MKSSISVVLMIATLLAGLFTALLPARPAVKPVRIPPERRERDAD